MLKLRIDELEHLIQEKPCLSISRHRFKEKFLEGGGNENMEGLDEYDLNLRSTMIFKKQKIKLPI
jgi:hypothetical protein